MTDSQTDLRATLAMRVEDLRIARKHRAEAGARVMTAASVRAYNGAVEWEAECQRREQAARGALIRHSLAPQVAA